MGQYYSFNCNHGRFALRDTPGSYQAGLRTREDYRIVIAFPLVKTVALDNSFSLTVAGAVPELLTENLCGTKKNSAPASRFTRLTMPGTWYISENANVMRFLFS